MANATCGSLFISWIDGPCSGSTYAACNFTLTEDLTISAAFDHDPTYEGIKQYRLKVIRGKVRKGEGVIVSDDGSIHCTSDRLASQCDALYYEGCDITLNSETEYPNTFLGWSPRSLGCEGPSCTVTVDKNKKAKALFSGPNKLKVTIVSKNQGSGVVISTDPGTRISCPDECIELYQSGERVTLRAQSNNGSSFTEWKGGGCTGSFNPECTVSMDKSLTVKAIFTGP